MRQGLVRGLALCALVVVACAPVATAGAAGDGTAGTAGSAPPVTVAAPPHRAVTWADVAGRLRQQGHLPHTEASTPAGARAAVLSPAAPAPQPADAVPVLTVTPSTDLASGDQVTVAGSGFAPGRYLLVECRAGGASPVDCDLSGEALVQPDASGAFSTSQSVRRTLRLFEGRFDCATAAGACEVVAIAIDSEQLLATARAPITFDPNAPTPDPSIVVTPATALRDGQTTSVAGSGFAPGSIVALSQCVVDARFCNSGFGVPSLVGADGRFTAQFPVSLRANDDFGMLTDCIAVPCEIVADSYDAPDYSTSAPIAFDPSQPVPPPPAVTVTPATGLHHDQQVQVHGTGYMANAYVEITECPPSTFGSCGEYLSDLQADASGTFDTTVRVSRLVSSWDAPIDTPERSIVDCASTGCSISASSYDPRVSLVAAASIAFDASVPPPELPTVTVTPDSDLPYRAVVAVHGTGYSPGEWVYADFCVESATDGICGASYGSQTAGPDGTVDLTVAVRRRYTFGASVLDCVAPGTSCSIEVSGGRSYEYVSVPVTFDPDAAVPPPPTATISPDHDLGYRQTVALTGHGFTPGPVGVQECGTFDSGGPFLACGSFDQVAADASGDLSAPIALTRVLQLAPGLQVDCATAPQPCVLQVGNFDDELVTVPLAFDPNSQPPPPPVLTVTPATSLFDGQHVTVAGRNYTPGSVVGVTECRAGAAAIADGCDISQVRIATVGTDGTFSRRFVTESVLGTSAGPVDCTVRAGACVLAAANAPRQPDFAAAALTFDPPRLAVTGVGVTEGTGGMTMAPVRVELSKPDRNPIVVHWVAVPETATPGTDYTSMRGTLTIPAGETEAMVHASVVADAMDEPTETFRVRVVDAAGAKIVDRTGTVTIHDDDAAPSVTVHDTSRREDHGEAHAEVTLSAPSGRTVIVHYVTHHRTARAGSDYVRKDSRLVFLPGQTRHLVRVVLVDDHVHEPTETFVVGLDRLERASAARSVGTVTITDDD